MTVNEIGSRFAVVQSFDCKITIRKDRSGATKFVDQMAYHTWASMAMSLLNDFFGNDSLHFQNFKRLYDANPAAAPSRLAILRGIFQGAKNDFEHGFLGRLEASMSGELLGDFVGLAKEVLREGHKDVAAVLACAALEDALKRFARLRNLDVDGKVMQEVVASLKASRLVGGAQKTLLDAMPKIRDYAMHANWAKLTDADVSSVIGFVEQFLISNFQPRELDSLAQSLRLTRESGASAPTP